MDKLTLSKVATNFTIKELLREGMETDFTENIRRVIRQKLDYYKNEGLEYKKFLLYSLASNVIVRVSILCNEYISSIAIITIYNGTTKRKEWNMNMEYHSKNNVLREGIPGFMYCNMISGVSIDSIDNDMIYRIDFVTNYKNGIFDRYPVKFKGSDIMKIVNGATIPQAISSSVEYPKGNILDTLYDQNNILTGFKICAILTDLAFHGYWNEWTSNIKGSNIYNITDTIWNITLSLGISIDVTPSGKLSKLECKDSNLKKVLVMYNPVTNIYYNEITGKPLEKTNGSAIELLRTLEALGCDPNELYCCNIS